jgi:hypothetical protein
VVQTQPVARPTLSKARRRFIPPQHGAWAMLAGPYLAGLLAAGWRWTDAPLAVAALGGYLASYYLSLAVKARRPGRYRTQLAVYLPATGLAVAVVVAAAPGVLWYAPCYALLVAVNLWYAHRRDDRSLLSGVSSAVQGCLLVLVVGTIAGPLDRPLWIAFGVVTAYFVGTVVYVKTMIRERDNFPLLWLSIVYHVAVTAAAALVAPVAVPLSAGLAIRATWMPSRTIAPHTVPPRTVGLLELTACAGLLVTVVLV